ncbi:MAG: glycosyltransferase family 2 protein [Thermodesulfobacteriota bacterium]
MNDIHPRIRLTVVITVYSEEGSLKQTIERLKANDRGYIHEIILVVCPRSTRRCLDICRALSAEDPRVISRFQENPGVGRAVREGMAAATGDYVAIMSADLETEPEAVDRMVREIQRTGCQAVVASRWMEGGGFTHYHPVKLWLNWLFQQIFKRIYATDIGDLTYGFKILQKSLVEAIPWEGTLHEIFIETTLKPLLENASIRQVPTVWKGREEGVSKNNFYINCRYVWLALRLIRHIPKGRGCASP